MSVPDAYINVSGETYGGAYWTRAEYLITLTARSKDEWEVQVEDTATVLDTLTLNAEQAIDILAAIEHDENWPEVPGLSVKPVWDVGHALSEDNVQLTDLSEVREWLRYFIGYDEWPSDQTEWEF